MFQKQQTSLIAGLRKTNEQAVDMSNEKVDKEKLEAETQVFILFFNITPIFPVDTKADKIVTKCFFIIYSKS